MRNFVLSSSNRQATNRISPEDAQRLKLTAADLRHQSGVQVSKNGEPKSQIPPPANLVPRHEAPPLAGFNTQRNEAESSIDGGDDARLDSDPEDINLENQELLEWMNGEAASLGPEGRREAGFGHLESHFTNQNALYAHSYPSTTSGHADEDQDEAVFSADPMVMQPPPRTSATHMEPKINEHRNYGARHIQDLANDYRTAAQARLQAEVPKPTPAAGSKRKTPGESSAARYTELHSHERSEPTTPRANGLKVNFMNTNSTEQLSSGSKFQHSNIPVREDPARNINRQHNADPPVTDLTELDHEPKTLYAMNFSALQNEPFDKDPSAKSSGLGGTQSPASLTTRLEQVSHRPVEDQQRFLASLSLVEWEQAGDWLMSKFKEATEKLARSRKERREIAAEFEEEIAKRYQAVTQETQSLDTSLKEMKERGTMVLSPESGRKKK